MNYFLELSKSVLLIVQKMVQSDFGRSLETGCILTSPHLIWAAGPDSIFLAASYHISPLGI